MFIKYRILCEKQTVDITSHILLTNLTTEKRQTQLAYQGHEVQRRRRRRWANIKTTSIAILELLTFLNDRNVQRSTHTKQHVFPVGGLLT